MRSRRGIVAGTLTLQWIFCGWASSFRHSELPAEASVDLGGGVRMEFVLVKPGTFTMGDDQGTDREKPAHKVTLTRAFYLGKYEVTRQQYYAVVRGDAGRVDRPMYPVDFARRSDAQEFLARLNREKPGTGFRLPAEAEWEYACRAGTRSRFSFGEDAGALAAYAWFGEIAGGSAHPVGQKKPNPWGLYDMHGNVWEWCQDRLGPYEVRDQVDPAGPDAGPQHVFRGGAWNCPADRCRSASRDSFPAAAFVVGFRVVLPVPAQR